MTAFGRIVRPATLMVAAAAFMSVSGTARAETGWLWFDSVFAVPRAAPSSINRQPLQQPVKRTKIVRPVIAPAPAPRPILVSATASEVRPNCFWCGRPVYVSGLSF
jgi:hypothetical protein